MALGGGRFTAMNKVLPGTYINIVTRAAEKLGIDNGVVAVPIVLNWCAKGSVVEITRAEFEGKCLKKLGYENTDPAILPIREIFAGGATKAVIYNLNNGTKAANTYATALHEGTRGNDVKIKISANVDNTDKYDVTTIVDNIDRDVQTVATASELKANDWVEFKSGAVLEVKAATPLTGGANGTVSGTQYQAALTALEQKYFNVLVCDATDPTTVNLFVAYVIRMREQMGKDFQMVVANKEADYEGIINVATAVTEPNGSLVYWVAGKSASCAMGKSNTNAIYDGSYTPVCNESQLQLETAIGAGKFVFHQVGGDIRVLMDINSLVSYTADKTEDMSKNEVVRVTDYLNNSIADLFSTSYIGKVVNNATGRAHLRQDIAAIHDRLVEAGAIEYDGKDLTVTVGDGKGDVIVEDLVTVNAAMIRLYMTISIN